MKYFLLCFMAVGTHAKKMMENGSMEKDSKYLLLKTKNKNTNENKVETVQSNDGVCSESKGVKGPCRAAHTRWTYDKDSGKCEKFIYGGCKGNGNNFKRKSGCKNKCGKGRVSPASVACQNMPPNNKVDHFDYDYWIL